MMRCPYCDQKIRDDAQFCNYCGKKIIRCPKCNKVLTDEVRFCPDDGTKIGAVNKENVIFSSKKNNKKHYKGYWILAIILLLSVLVGAGCIAFFCIIYKKDNTLHDYPNEEIQESTISYQNGDYVYVPSEEHIALDEEEQILYYDNILTVYFNKEITDKEKKLLENQANGQIVSDLSGVINSADIYCGNSNLKELEEKAKQLSTLDFVQGSIISVPEYLEENTSTDLWNGDDDLENEDSPSGADWWAEAIKAYTAWNYSIFESSVMVGIIDNGFDYNHNDFIRDGTSVITMLNNNTIDDENPSHGTKVAGLIAAQDNNVGSRGVIPYADVVCIDETNRKSEFATLSQLSENIKIMLEEAEKKDEHIVINCSFGNNLNYSDFLIARDYTYAEGYDTIAIQQQSQKILNAIYMKIVDQLLQFSKSEFLIVNSAGNGYSNSGPGYDARYYGGFTGINEDTEKILEKFNCSLTFDYKLIKEHLISVAAVKNEIDEKNRYKFCLFSNYGDNIDIAAPGKKIYSTAIDNKYAYSDGTSEAAPIVSGSAAYIWSLNPDLSPAEVKQKLIDTAGVAVGVTGDDKGREYPMLNLGAAATSAVMGTVTCKVTDIDGNPLAEVDCNRNCDLSDDEIFTSNISTNTDGEMYSSAVGNMTYTFCKEGYETVTKDITVNARTDVDLGTIVLKLSQNETFANYLDEVLAQSLGIVNSQQSGIASFASTYDWFNGEGILSAVVEDFDQDQVDEMLVVYTEKNTADTSGEYYDLYLEMYEVQEGKVTSVCKIPFKSYYQSNDGNQYSFLASLSPSYRERASAYLCSINGHNYIICENLASAFLSNGGNDEKWMLEYTDGQFKYVGEFVQNGVGDGELLWYGNQFENGTLVQSDVYCSQYNSGQGLYSDYASALEGYFQQFGIETYDNSSNIHKSFLKNTADYKELFTFTNTNVGRDANWQNYECVARIQSDCSEISDQKITSEILLSTPWWCRIDDEALLLAFKEDGAVTLLGKKASDTDSFEIYPEALEAVGSYTIAEDTVTINLIYSSLSQECILQPVLMNQSDTSLLQKDGLDGYLQTICDNNNYNDLSFIQDNYLSESGIEPLWLLPADITDFSVDYQSNAESQGQTDLFDDGQLNEMAHNAYDQYINNKEYLNFEASASEAIFDKYAFCDINNDGMDEMLLAHYFGPYSYDEELYCGGVLICLEYDVVNNLVNSIPVLEEQTNTSESNLSYCVSGDYGPFYDGNHNYVYFILEADGQYRYYQLIDGCLQFVQREYRDISSSDEIYIRENFITGSKEEVTADDINQQSTLDTFGWIELYPYEGQSTVDNTQGDSVTVEENIAFSGFYGIWCSASQSSSEAEEYLAYAQNAGFSNAQIFLTTDWSNLNSQPYYVVSCGVYVNETDANSALPSVQAVYPDAYVKYSGVYQGNN